MTPHRFASIHSALAARSGGATALQFMRHMRRWSAGVLAASLALALPTVAQEAAKAIATAKVQSAPVGVRLELDGVVQAVRQSTVSAQANGRIATLRAKAGDSVKAGQLLATIDDREASVGMQQSQAQTQQADADLRNAQAQFARTRDLQAQGFVSKAALDVAQAQLQSAQAQRDQASAAMRMSGLSKSYTQVTAPFDGWILQTHAEAGDLAVPGKPLLTLYAPQPLRVAVQVPASRAQAAREASDVQIQWGADQDAASGWIAPMARRAVPASDPVAQTTEWRLDLPANAAARLVPGQQVRVRFALPAAGSGTVLVVPEAAIVRRSELSAVYVQSGKAFALRAVRLGQAHGQTVEVLAGLREGDVVALDPLAAARALAAPADRTTP